MAGVATLLAAGRASGRQPGAASGPSYGPFGLDIAGMDQTIHPGDDFYRYMNGGWLRAAVIPPDQTGWSPANESFEVVRRQLRDILEAASLAPTSDTERKVGDYYATLLDEAAIEARGAGPLQPELSRIAAITDRTSLARALGALSRDSLGPAAGGGALASPPIVVGVLADLKRPERVLPTLGQGGLGMGDREVYLGDQPGAVAARANYQRAVAALLSLSGHANPDAGAVAVCDLERALAATHRSAAEMRNIERRYNLLSVTQIKDRAPGLDWDTFLDAAGLEGRSELLVGQPEAMAGAAKAAAEAPLSVWRDYLTSRAICRFARAGPSAFAQALFALEGGARGATARPPRWEQAYASTDLAIGQGLGRLYLARHWPPEARAEALAMAEGIKAAMARRIQALDWMGAGTKRRALDKLEAVRVEVGSEEPARDYAGLTVVRGDAYGNLLRASRFQYDRNLAKLDRPTDRREWQLRPHSPDAQSIAYLCKFTLPAAMLRPPRFDPKADAAVNYGGIGVVIAHELVHQFDDQGAQFDERGALNNWWEPEDFARFRAAGARMAAQYSAYEPLPGVKINGQLTLGESIADLAGVAIAYDAYHASLRGAAAPVLGGFTADQRFFMAYAQAWRGVQQEAALRRGLAVDAHPPREYRTKQVRNLEAWHRAFDVRPGRREYLAPGARVQVW